MRRDYITLSDIRRHEGNCWDYVGYDIEKKRKVTIGYLRRVTCATITGDWRQDIDTVATIFASYITWMLATLGKWISRAQIFDWYKRMRIVGPEKRNANSQCECGTEAKAIVFTMFYIFSLLFVCVCLCAHILCMLNVTAVVTRILCRSCGTFLFFSFFFF